jgi:hypothetical protein
VEEGLIGEIEDPFEAVKWQQVLGGEGFLRKLKDHWNQRAERPKNYGQKRNWSAVGAEQILERVSEHFQSDLERLKQRSIRNNLARRCAITLCWDHAGLSHDEIASLFRKRRRGVSTAWRHQDRQHQTSCAQRRLGAG